jgi:hypothetical protein
MRIIAGKYRGHVFKGIAHSPSSDRFRQLIHSQWLN